MAKIDGTKPSAIPHPRRPPWHSPPETDLRRDSYRQSWGIFVLWSYL